MDYTFLSQPPKEKGKKGFWKDSADLKLDELVSENYGTYGTSLALKVNT